MSESTPRKLVRTFLALVWLTVVGVSVYIAVTRHEEYGYFAYVVTGIAVFMLIIFCLAFLPRKASESSFGERLGKLSVGALILFALVALGGALVQFRRNIIGVIVLGLFFITFLRIFKDWLKHYLGGEKPPRRRPKKAEASASENGKAQTTTEKPEHKP